MQPLVHALADDGDNFGDARRVSGDLRDDRAEHDAIILDQPELGVARLAAPHRIRHPPPWREARIQRVDPVHDFRPDFHDAVARDWLELHQAACKYELNIVLLPSSLWLIVV